MTVEPALTCTKVEDNVDLCFISSFPAVVYLASRLDHTVYHKFMQLAPPCSWLDSYRDITRTSRRGWTLREHRTPRGHDPFGGPTIVVDLSVRPPSFGFPLCLHKPLMS